jgi:hypothetical protein
LGDHRVRRSPLQENGLAGSISDRESGALIHGVGEEIHDPPAPRVEIDLDDVAFGIAEKSGLISLIRGRIIQARFGECEHWLHGSRLRGNANRYQRQRKNGEASRFSRHHP